MEALLAGQKSSQQCMWLSGIRNGMLITITPSPSTYPSTPRTPPPPASIDNWAANHFNRFSFSWLFWFSMIMLWAASSLHSSVLWSWRSGWRNVLVNNWSLWGVCLLRSWKRKVEVVTLRKSVGDCRCWAARGNAWCVLLIPSLLWLNYLKGDGCVLDWKYKPYKGRRGVIQGTGSEDEQEYKDGEFCPVQTFTDPIFSSEQLLIYFYTLHVSSQKPSEQTNVYSFFLQKCGYIYVKSLVWWWCMFNTNGLSNCLCSAWSLWWSKNSIQVVKGWRCKFWELGVKNCWTAHVLLFSLFSAQL